MTAIKLKYVICLEYVLMYVFWIECIVMVIGNEIVYPEIDLKIYKYCQVGDALECDCVEYEDWAEGTRGLYRSPTPEDTANAYNFKTEVQEGNLRAS